MLNHMVYLNFEDNNRSFIMSHSKLFSVHQHTLCQINLHSYKELILILLKVLHITGLWWLTHIILATWEAENGTTVLQASQGKKSMRPHLNQ
jgi:hypothetical protein